MAAAIPLGQRAEPVWPLHMAVTHGRRTWPLHMAVTRGRYTWSNLLADESRLVERRQCPSTAVALPSLLRSNRAPSLCWALR